MKRTLPILHVLPACLISSLAAFEHPGGMHLKIRLEVHDSSAYGKMLTFAKPALTHSPHAVADFDVPGAYTDADGHRDMSRNLQLDARDAYACAMAYALKRDPVFAEKAEAFLMAWARVNSKVSGADGNLVMAYAGSAAVMAADLLGGYAGWLPEDRLLFSGWVHNVYLKSSRTIRDKKNNWGAWGTFGSILSLHYLDAPDSMKIEIGRLKRHLDSQITEDGSMPAELKRGDKALSYTYFALAPLAAACEVVRNATGENLYLYNRSRIKKAMDWLLPYLMDPGSFPGVQPQANPQTPDGRAGNLVEAMWHIYRDPDYDAWVGKARPIQHFGYGDAHHFAWAFPTLVPPAATSSAAGISTLNGRSRKAVAGAVASGYNLIGQWRSP